MSLGARLFAALAVVGLLPVALTGSVTYAVNRDEIAKTVGRSQEVIGPSPARLDAGTSGLTAPKGLHSSAC